MDSGDHSDKRLKAPDMGGFRSQSFSNLFQGFFGVKRTPASISDIPSSGTSDGDKGFDGRSLETIISPTNDEESWILSHFLRDKFEKDDVSLKRNTTWSELGRLGHIHSPDSGSLASSTTDITKADGNRRHASGGSTATRIHVKDDLTAGSKNQPDEIMEKSEEPAKPKIIISKGAEHAHYPKNILSSFLSHDVPHSEIKQSDRSSDLDQTRYADQHTTMMSSSEVSSSEVAIEARPHSKDQVDKGLVTNSVMPGEKIPESKPTLKDFLWSLNHEKINVSKKEMNLMASIDQ